MEGTFLSFNIWVKIIFDFGATHSLVSTKLLHLLDLECQPQDSLLNVEQPVERILDLGIVCRDCEIDMGNHRLVTDLIVMDVTHYDVILGIDWLSSFCAIINCYNKNVRLIFLMEKNFTFLGKFHILLCIENNGFFTYANSKKPRDYFGWLVSHLGRESSKGKEKPPLVVDDFIDVFPNELPRLPLKEKLIFQLKCTLKLHLFLCQFIGWL